MNIRPKRLVVVAGQGPDPAETFIRRDLAALRERGWETQCFGLDQRFATPVPATGEAAALPPLA
ncbi:MAG: hypothetical protein GX590_04370, partial [Lentisphaerae bacterium]|nr:hypothetical protein [Lentisphaerota bacterium]